MPGKVSAQPLAPLLIWDRLEVGPVRVEPRRLTATYTVVRAGRRESTDLIYSYEEDVFTPGEAADENLAAMITAQVALNYGLFAPEIVFHGAFDERDRRFLNDMAANTAREIYVKKFLQPNPFLVGAAAQLPVDRSGEYLQARLTFPDPEPATGGGGAGWERDPQACAVLSSGGKDSLLSYGLLAECGAPVHPIFVNESGRHWFTALNAYRHFKDHVPGTARVWTNCDRVYRVPAAPDAVHPPRFRRCARRHLSGAPVDGGRISVRGPADHAQAGHRPPGHRRRIRHQSARAASGHPALRRASTTRVAGSIWASAATSSARAGAYISSRSCVTCRNS